MSLREEEMRRDFNEFKDFIKGKRTAVVGIGVSNTPVIRKLAAYGAIVTAFDKRTVIDESEAALKELGVEFSLGESYLDNLKGFDVIFRTPSMLPTNEYLMRAHNEGCYVTSEMREFLKYCPCKIYGVTGSDGKTTTTTLISEILSDKGYRVHLGGNIGTPLFDKIEDIRPEDRAVVELSSFQLMDCDISADIAVVTNLTPNHLDMHKNMEEYRDAKKNIYIHQDSSGIAVFNHDNSVTEEMKNEAAGEGRYFSVRGKSSFAELKDGYLTVNGEKVCRTEEVRLVGMHNVENLLAAFSAVYDETDIDNMRKVAMNFAGVAHRIEPVRVINGIAFYNDSIASSPARTIAGLKSFNQKVILIAGGYDKKIPFEELAKEGIGRIKILILMGKTKAKIREAFEKELKLRGESLTIIEAESLEDAVNKAYSNAGKGDVVTLSPACASFDMFKNFEVRGNAFKDIVNKL